VQCEFLQESFHYKYKGKAALFIVLVHLVLSGSVSCTATYRFLPHWMLPPYVFPWQGCFSPGLRSALLKCPWVVIPCGLAGRYLRFGGTYCPDLQHLMGPSMFVCLSVSHHLRTSKHKSMFSPRRALSHQAFAPFGMPRFGALSIGLVPCSLASPLGEYLDLKGMK
jgi:hypothetical protein